MTMTVRQRKNIIRNMAMLFAEEGKVLTIAEYKELPSEKQPHRISQVRNAGGSWSRMLQRMKTQEPELWDMANGEKELQHEFMAEKVREEIKGGPSLSNSTGSDERSSKPEEETSSEDIAEAMKKAGEVNDETDE